MFFHIGMKLFGFLSVAFVIRKKVPFVAFAIRNNFCLVAVCKCGILR